MSEGRLSMNCMVDELVCVFSVIFVKKLNCMMRVTIEISNPAEMEKLFVVLKTINFENVHVVSGGKAQNGRKSVPTITKGNKEIDPKALFGIWKDSPRSLEQIRAIAWDRNWSV
jgi:hypothetical protein